ncbi:Protoporphyrinogen oxidase [Lentinus tigrinus ALCF2SS1-6]|uniref:Protoporphyrinogen oxidase n=1 Tax=Lentinus tigrinus ALCF2SS1-6 TaxID=1328759 RepID=A0A5C2S4L4_9APHY|nr:Protoporphyrinogen oxidase [Lentinus tigrinus ALCF2SS1-6]
MLSPKSVTVLGGGITGLSAALHLSRRLPAHSAVCINLIERSARLGGWVFSERVQVKAKGHEADVLLESGPRTLRPNSKALLELIHLLDLAPSILTVPRSAPAARNRFLRLPSSDGLTTIPSSFISLLASPLATILVPAVLRDVRRTSGKVLNMDSSEDESVDAFLTRHFGAEFARTFGSALVHGIYATDSRILSTRAAFPTLRQLEQHGNGSVVRGAFAEMFSSMRSSKLSEIPVAKGYDLGDVVDLMKGVSVYSFHDGMQTLTQSMATHLQEQPNVNILQRDGAQTLRKNNDHYEVTTESGRRITSTHLLAALPLPQLHHILEDSSSSHADIPALPQLPHLENPSSSVTVVNLIFPPSSTPIHPDGFGYLIPRPSNDYPASSLGMLGTVFDSSALSGQDHYPTANGNAQGKFVKLTIMLGGPYGKPSPTPSSPEFLPALLNELQTHLGRREPLPEPCVVKIREHQDCIPTPTVGHTTRMKELAAAVKERWGPNAAVIGAGVGGVSIGDCVESGRRAAYELSF